MNNKARDPERRRLPNTPYRAGSVHCGPALRKAFDMALVSTKEMFRKAYEGGYAIGAFNINNMEIIQAITEAAAEEKSPVILQVSAGARKYAKPAYLLGLAEAAVKDSGVDFALHLDHGADFDICKSCIDGGFTSVMIDGSQHSFEDNIALTKKVVEYAHAHGVVVEGELGKLAGIEDDVNVSAEDSSYTRPEEVEEFVSRTGVDSLAIAIGTSHGAYKFTPEQCTRNADGLLVPPPLRFDILKEIEKRLPGFPIVLHGASSVPQEFVREINALGGKLPDAIGIPEDRAAPGCSDGCLQDQHRLRYPSCHDRRDPPRICGKAPGLRPQRVSRRGPHRRQGNGHPQDPRRPRLRRQSLIVYHCGLSLWRQSVFHINI